jgi:hypothetical protein
MLENRSVLSVKMSLCITLLFVALGAFGIMHHEIWLDEAHHWLLARDSNSIPEMFYNARYEGHPALWNVLLYVVSHFSADPFVMQLLNLVLATIAVFLFLRFSPFTFFVSIGIVFSYFILYEYTVISRNYMLAFLLLVIACALFRDRQKRFLLLAIVLVLLSQVHLFATIIAAGLFSVAVWEYFFTDNKKRYKHFYAGAVLLLISFGLVLWQIIPPHDHFLYQYDDDKLLSFERIGKAASVLWKGFFPLPDFSQERPWNTNLVVGFSKHLAIIPIVLAWLVPMLLIKTKPARVFFYAVACCIVLFIYLSPLIVASRHCGFFFLLLISALWIDNYFPATTPGNTKFTFFRKAAKPILAVMLVVQFIAGVYLYIVDWRRPFSNGKAVAEWVKTNVDPKKMVIVSGHYSGPPVSAYLGRKVYYVENNCAGSFFKWNTTPYMITQDTLFSKISKLVYDKNKGALWLISNEPLAAFAFEKYPAIKTFDVKLVTQFTGALVQAENYWIYSVTPKQENEVWLY